MATAQIIVLIVGAILFTVSFLIPERQSNQKKDNKIAEKQIKEALDREMESFRNRMEDAALDTISHSKDTTERYMERITNEKMMAISEYSDTVMQQIHKDHEEAVFLYDMLNNKHAQIKNTSVEVNDTLKNVKRFYKEQEEKHSSKDSDVLPTGTPDLRAKESLSSNANAQKTILSKQEKNTHPGNQEDILFEPIAVQRVEKQIKDAEQRNAQKEQKGVEILFDSENTEVNNNEKILSLHKQGKSNMAIAKELGLGIGEVKLVIDLFEGM